MAKRIHVEEHLSLEDLDRLRQTSGDAVERRNAHVIWLAQKGLNSPAIVEATGYRRDWVFVIVKRYNEEGPGALKDGRARNGRKPQLLTPQVLAELEVALEQPPEGGGAWDSPRVAEWLARRTGRTFVHNQRGWDALKKLGYTTQSPRPRHVSADENAQEAFKKGGWHRPLGGS